MIDDDERNAIWDWIETAKQDIDGNTMLIIGVIVVVTFIEAAHLWLYH